MLPRCLSSVRNEWAVVPSSSRLECTLAKAVFERLAGATRSRDVLAYWSSSATKTGRPADIFTTYVPDPQIGTSRKVDTQKPRRNGWTLVSHIQVNPGVSKYKFYAVLRRGVKHSTLTTVNLTIC